MTATRPARRKFCTLQSASNLLTSHSIIQDCEDSLTNWVEQNAAVSSKLSTRARNLSQRRKARHDGAAVDLSGLDAPMEGNRESGMWVSADQHGAEEYDDEEEAESVSEARGREEAQAA